MDAITKLSGSHADVICLILLIVWVVAGACALLAFLGPLRGSWRFGWPGALVVFIVGLILWLVLC